MRSGALLPAAVFAGALALQGCEGIALTMLGVGTGTAAGTGVNHTLSGISYKTFNASVEDVHVATLTALERMGITVGEDEATPEGRRIRANVADRAVEIELEMLTSRATRMSAVAKQGLVLRDAATSTEIILQTAHMLDDQLAQRESPR
jgi:trimethylamine:corrinoid methyltransferase-like protein